jgi:hypothetical protein
MDITDFEKKYRARREIFKEEIKQLKTRGGIEQMKLDGIKTKAAIFFEEMIDYAMVSRNKSTNGKLCDKIDHLGKIGALNSELVALCHNLREKRNSIMHPGETMTREHCSYYLADILKVRNVLSPFDKDIAKRHTPPSNAGTLEYATGKTEKLLYWLSPDSHHKTANDAKANLDKYKDFWFFSLRQGYFFSHEVTDMYHELAPKARGAFISRLSRDGWIYTTGETSAFLSESKKYYINPNVTESLKRYFKIR